MRITPVAQHSTNNEIEYYIGLTKLPVVDRITDLGIAYNNRPKFSPHVDNIVSKVSLRAKLILRCFQSRDPVLLTKHLVFLSHLSLNLVLLSGTQSSNKTLLELSQSNLNSRKDYMVSVISHILLDCHIWVLIVCNVDALMLTCVCVIRLLIIIYALRLFPFVLFVYQTNQGSF